MSGAKRRPRKMLSRRSEVLKHARASRSDAKTGSCFLAMAAASATVLRNKVPYLGTPPGIHLGRILGASWADLGRIFGVSWEDLARILGGSWAHLGRTLRAS